MEIYRKFQVILNRKQKRQVMGLGILMFFGSLLEMMSVAIVIPFISMILNPQVVQQNKYLSCIYQYMNFSSTNTFLIVLGLCLILLFFLKNLYLLMQYRLQFKFVYSTQMEMSVRLMRIYMKKPYVFFLTRNPAEILRTIKDDINYAFQLLLHMLQGITESLVALVLVAFLLLVDAKMTIFVSVLLILTVLVIKKIVQPTLRRAGHNAQKSSAEMMGWINQGIRGIKEVKIARQEDTFADGYARAGQVNIQARKSSDTLDLLPRFAIETICISGVVAYIIVSIALGVDLSKMIPQISAVAMAAVRLMPSANRINRSLNMISYLRVNLDSVYEVLTSELEKWEDTKKRNETAEIDFQQEIHMSGISYHYPDSEENVLENVNLTIPKGKSVGIMGKSGSGKTTLVNILLGLLTPCAGGLYVDGIKIGEENYAGWLKNIGYVPQDIFLLNGSVAENVAFGEVIDGESIKRIERALEDAQLKEFVENLEKGIYTQVGENGIRLSGGQRQRLGIARALYHNPSVIVFDEATSSLDHETEAEVMRAINGLQGKTTMIIVAHRLNTIEQCDLHYRVEKNQVVLLAEN